MFPMSTPEIVRAEQTHRLEGFRRWSRRRAVDAPYAAPARPAALPDEVGGGRARRPAARPVLGR